MWCHNRSPSNAPSMASLQVWDVRRVSLERSAFLSCARFFGCCLWTSVRGTYVSPFSGAQLPAPSVQQPATWRRKFRARLPPPERPFVCPLALDCSSDELVSRPLHPSLSRGLFVSCSATRSLHLSSANMNISELYSGCTER